MIWLLLFSFQANATSYNKDALPIFTNRCSVCHNANSMPDKNWLDYNIAKAKKDLILKRAYTDKDMPPGNATSITDLEREVLRSWIQEGANP